MIRRAARCLLFVSSLSLLSGCCPRVYIPKIGFQRIDVKLCPADPVFVGCGGAGPIWAPPEVTSPCRVVPEDPCNPCDPCRSGCNPPTLPLQPVDPFGWIGHGSMGTQEIDPIGWVFGI